MLNKSYVLVFDIFTLNIFVVLCVVSKPYAFVLVLKMVLVKIKGQVTVYCIVTNITVGICCFGFRFKML